MDFILRAAAHDEYSPFNGALGSIPSSFSTSCLVNASEFVLYDKDFKQYLHPCPESVRTSERDSLASFFRQLDFDKQLWRPIQQTSVRIYRKAIYLSTKTHDCLVNTGLGTLMVGDTFYAMPAVPHLANNNASVNLFDVQGNTYVHPILLSRQDREMLLNDIFDLLEDNTSKMQTLLGGLMQKHCDGEFKDSIVELLAYMRVQRPIGAVVYPMNGMRRSVYDVSHNVASLGSQFLCTYQVF